MRRANLHLAICVRAPAPYSSGFREHAYVRVTTHEGGNVCDHVGCGGHVQLRGGVGAKSPRRIGTPAPHALSKRISYYQKRKSARMHCFAEQKWHRLLASANVLRVVCVFGATPMWRRAERKKTRSFPRKMLNFRRGLTVEAAGRTGGRPDQA